MRYIALQLLALALCYADRRTLYTGRSTKANDFVEVSASAWSSLSLRESPDEPRHHATEEDKLFESPLMSKLRVRRSAEKAIQIISLPLHDNNTNAFIGWAGSTGAMVALTRTTYIPRRATLYVSYDSGASFQNVVEKNIHCLCFTYPNGTRVDADIDRFYHAPQKTYTSASNYIFTDGKNRVIASTHDLRHFNVVPVTFAASLIAFHPTDEDTLLALGKDSTGVQNLYVSLDFGASWQLVAERVKAFDWGWDHEKVYVSVKAGLSLGLLFGVDSYDILEIHIYHLTLRRTVMSMVIDFEIRGPFIFATKTPEMSILQHRVSLPTNHVNLWVAQQGNDSLRFQMAQFPHFNLTNLEYFIVEAEDGRVMVTVSHGAHSAHLYVSDANGLYYTLSLPNIVYYSPDAGDDTPLWMQWFYKEPFADIHKVEGMRGIYIASQLLSNSTNVNFADLNQTTRITYDKGGVWTHLHAPYQDSQGDYSHCYWYRGCTLHLAQQFQFNRTYKPQAILSSANAPGLVMGSGVLGDSLKPTNESIAVYMSTDGGINWEEIIRGSYLYNFGDHGGILVMVKSREATKDFLYSLDEGFTWNSYQFSANSIVVYGLLTEPGSISGNFSLWGSLPGRHSWVVIQIDMTGIFDRNCGPADYKLWTPGMNDTTVETCILGESENIERRKPKTLCFNTREFDRINITSRCKCKRIDYECDYGYIPEDETDQVWNPSPTWYQKELSNCLRDPDVTDVIISKPEYCPFGSTYTISRGYRKIPEDNCQPSDAGHIYEPIVRNCPFDNKTEFIIYSSGLNIYRYVFDTARIEALHRGGMRSSSEIYSVEYDYKNDILYWADQDLNAILMKNLSSGAADDEGHILVSGNILKIDCISLDWESGNIYLVDAQTPKIEIITTSRHSYGNVWRRTIVNNTDPNNKILDRPRALEVYPSHGIMFWTDWSNEDPRVMRATMAGYNATKILGGPNIDWPNGLAIDYTKELLYVIDGHTHKLISIDLFGNHETLILEDPRKILHPFALGVYKNRVYWSEWADNQIKSVYRDTGAGFEVVVNRTVNRITSLKVMHWDKQYETGETGCGPRATHKGGCSNICVPHAHEASNVTTNRLCLCPEEAPARNKTASGSEDNCTCTHDQIFNVTLGECTAPTGGSCEVGQYKCGTGSCIPSAWHCDHDNDCGDMSDEINCESGICQTDEFLCVAKQRCISRAWLCDGDDDCGDGSDENNTTVCRGAHPPCRSDQFQCQNYRCIPLSYKCDGEVDCGSLDDSDETQCGGNGTVSHCSTDQFPCTSSRFGLTCIPSSWKCDHEFDCDDRSDESNCQYSNATACNPDQFKCENNSRCIPQWWVCDHDNDCGDLSDERNCGYNLTTPVPPATPNTTADCWPCERSGRCIEFFEICNGRDDCSTAQISDRSDEYECITRSASNSTTTPSPRCYFRCRDNSCIHQFNYCDGIVDCFNHWNVSDEAECINCVGKVRCASNPNVCIYRTQLCDGHRDCLDGDDERGCSAPSTEIVPSCSGFLCADKFTCLDNRQVCNGHYDCMDGSDELFCSNSTAPTNLKLIGRNGTSISIRWQDSNPSNPNSQEIKYLIQYRYILDIRAVPASTWKNGTVTTVLTGILTGLVPYSNYEIAVRRLVGIKMSEPSKSIMSSTLEAPSGPVSNIQITGMRFSEWTLSWKAPASPNGVIQQYRVYVSDDDKLVYSRTVTKNEQGVVPTQATVRLNISPYRYRIVYTFKVVPVNGVGDGQPLTKNQSVLSEPPEVSCDPDVAMNSVTLHITSQGAALDDTYVITYDDVDGRLETKYYAHRPDGKYTVDGLSPDHLYGFRVEQVVPVESHTNVTSPSNEAVCHTTGKGVSVVTNLNATTTKDSVTITWSPIQAVKQYEVVVANTLADLQQKRYLFTYPVNETKASIPNLHSCEVYLYAIRAVAPSKGPLSAIRSFTTLYDELAPPKHLHAVDKRISGDKVTIQLSWQPSCLETRAAASSKAVDYIISVTENHHQGKVPSDNQPATFTISGNLTSYPITVNVSGNYSITMRRKTDGARISPAYTYWAAPYEAPELACSADGTTFEILFLTNDAPKGLECEIHIVEETSATLQDMGLNNCSRIPTWHRYPGHSGARYTVSVAHARRVGEHVFTGKPAQCLVAMPGDHQAHVSPAPHTGMNKKSVGLYVGASLGGMALLVVTTLLTVWCIRHRRLQRSFLNFTSSHYNSRTENATFGGDDDDDSPMIQGFSDDEPLVLA